MKVYQKQTVADFTMSQLKLNGWVGVSQNVSMQSNIPGKQIIKIKARHYENIWFMNINNLACCVIACMWLEIIKYKHGELNMFI